MKIILIGPQAAGKGTQGVKLAEKFKLPYVEMGKILRQIASEESPLGKKVNELINIKGVLVPDEIIYQVIEKHLKSLIDNNGFIIDGFPRVISQAEYFEKFLASYGEKVDMVIYLTLPKEETFRRLINRRVCQKCGRAYNLLTAPPKKEGICDVCGGKLIVRADETPEKIKTRLKEFFRQTMPVVDFYRKKGILEEIDGNQPIDIVFEDILSRLKRKGLIKG